MFLHSALTEALMLTSSATPAVQFPGVYNDLLQVDPDKRKRNIQRTYDVSTCTWFFGNTKTTCVANLDQEYLQIFPKSNISSDLKCLPLEVFLFEK